MKTWIKIAALVLVIAAVAYGLWRPSSQSVRSSVERIRRQLQAEGFKTELAAFDFKPPSDLEKRGRRIVTASEAIRPMRAYFDLQLMELVGTNVAVAISRVEVVETPRATNLWPLIQSEMAEHGEELDRACMSLLGGPFKFQPVVKGDILLPHLAAYATLSRVLSVRAVCALHERDTNSAFTDLHALSRMVTAWTPEPTDISHLVRFKIVATTFQALWESMQTDCWTEERLATMQREWESVRFFDALPETAELFCASLLGRCQAGRTNSYSDQIGGWGPVWRGVLDSPSEGSKNLWSTILGYQKYIRYQNHGSYEDELALMNYFRERRDALRRAVTCSTWAEMRREPGVTTNQMFQGAQDSRLGTLMRLKQTSLGLQAEGRTLLSGAAEAEAERRLIVTALALERFALQHKKYPAALDELVPSLLPSFPIDFMDGKPLRYERREDGRFVLYSVGLDCVDDGGQMMTPAQSSGERRRVRRFGALSATDIVWPRAASQADVDAFEASTRGER